MGEEPRAAGLVGALTEWAREDLLGAYEALCLALHWSEQTTWYAVWEGGELRAAAGRWRPAAGQPVPVQCYYVARDEASLQQVVETAPPAAGSLVCAPNTPCHALLCGQPGVNRSPSLILYAYEKASAPEGPEVCHLSTEEVRAAGLHEPWNWPTILLNQPAPRPIHCIVREGRIVAVAAAGSPTALTEEVRAVWVAGELRGQGLGRAVVAAATRDILGRGALPVYTTTTDNLASQRTAESVGYRRRGEMLRLSVTG